jgi:hypothetical protein
LLSLVFGSVVEMGVGVAALVFFWVGLLLAVVVPCMFAEGGAVVVANSKEEWSASSSRLEYGLKTEESGRMRMSDLFEKWVGSGGVVVAAGEKNKKKLLDDDDSTLQKKEKSREHVDDLKEELGCDSSRGKPFIFLGCLAACCSTCCCCSCHTAGTTTLSCCETWVGGLWCSLWLPSS